MAIHEVEKCTSRLAVAVSIRRRGSAANDVRTARLVHYTDSAAVLD